VIDRDYRIVPGIVTAKSAFREFRAIRLSGATFSRVLAKQPQGILREEFERAFQTGRIERIEQRDETKTATRFTGWSAKFRCAIEKPAKSRTLSRSAKTLPHALMRLTPSGRAEKLAAVGRLAAGVVHEINNPLATISACAESLESRVDEGAFGASPDVEDLHEYLGLIRSEAFRCKSITNGLLDFSRCGPGNRFRLILHWF
jgi:two-component system NtrC family sensor kinase